MNEEELYVSSPTKGARMILEIENVKGGQKTLPETWSKNTC
jgi:hypothetical protein